MPVDHCYTFPWYGCLHGCNSQQGDDAMNYLYHFQYLLRGALVAGHWLSIRLTGFARAMALAMLLGVVALAQPATVQAAEAATVAAAVNINTADAQTLAATLKGVGEARALEIIRYREAYGPFSSVDELAEVKGIGQATVDRNRAVITLE
jgi:competence protein ComEA